LDTADLKLDVNTELSARRTRMSFQRTRMAADRTLMAVIRTLALKWRAERRVDVCRRDGRYGRRGAARRKGTDRCMNG